MFKKFEIILDTPEIYIEVIGDDIYIKTPTDYLKCTPSEVLDSVKNVSYGDMIKSVTDRGESVGEYIKNWYLRA